LRQEPSALLARLNGRLLAVYGGKDTQVPGVANAEACIQATTGNPDVTVRVFPGHNHLFQLADSGAISEYADLPAGPDAAVLQAVAEWLDASF
jgi:hypothetical protein